MEKPRKVAPPTDLMAALKQSLAQMEKKKGPQRVEEAQEESEVEVKSVRPRKKPARRAA